MLSCDTTGLKLQGYRLRCRDFAKQMFCRMASWFLARLVMCADHRTQVTTTVVDDTPGSRIVTLVVPHDLTWQQMEFPHGGCALPHFPSSDLCMLV